MHELDKIVTKSVFANMTDATSRWRAARAPEEISWQVFQHGPEPAAAADAEKPTLLDTIKNRLASTNHLLQAARSAIRTAIAKRSCSPACSTTSRWSLIRCDHGYWGAQIDRALCRRRGELAIKSHQRCASSPTSRSATAIPICIQVFRAGLFARAYIHEEYKRARTTSTT